MAEDRVLGPLIKEKMMDEEIKHISSLQGEELIKAMEEWAERREALAEDRTKLAQFRTKLAEERTALAHRRTRTGRKPHRIWPENRTGHGEWPDRPWPNAPSWPRTAPPGREKDGAGG